ncbi:PREDICTED: storkhead-box protein 1 [Dipodomys ordii]|uniref:Storkhead-box protein 1 n=1 Tax=Dipodomys ordii TaxID=10020 RepID=A0A1S3F7D4_DIPOR|nr:PREDICTED: storkhead-box protein 1 [Dipodomys ordii]
MAGPVQLMPDSLALVLCRMDAREAAGAPAEPGGRAVFRAFRRANARCFWNARLARAASRLAFQGWLRRGVLLVHAPHTCLQVLRDAWRLRALRPPRGFRISAVGDVFPVQMNPIDQSQFVPLAEVVCCAISDMNAAQIVVTQESLLEHLMKHYPGIAIPPQDILYTTLGALIKERKIYHTGEGYFIVTPQTYFITNTSCQEDKRILLSKEDCLVPTSVTYLVNLESCTELAKEKAAPISHCPSCQCFSDMCIQDIEDPTSVAEVTRKGQKSPGESVPLVQNQEVSASQDTHICDSLKSLPYTKDKEKGRKFGFGFLWRSISRKEKPKAGHSSFSAQFPPEEWPVRDEDNLDNLPRHVEHEIIKRINPVLTVDNLIKHTLLMQNHEEQKKCNSQGTSTDRLTARPKCLSKEGVTRRQGRSAKPRRQGHTHRGRHKARSQGSIRLEKHSRCPAAQPTCGIKNPNEGEVQKLPGENPAVLGSHLIYKKRISNPFQGLSLRGSPITTGHYIQKTSHLKSSQTGPKEKPFQRTRSSGPSGIFDHEAQQPSAEQCYDKQKAESTYMTDSTVQPPGDDFRGGLLNYPQGGASQNDSHCCSVEESMLRCDVSNGENKEIPEVLRKSHFVKLGEGKETQNILPSQGSSLDLTSSACRQINKTTHQFQNLGLLDYPVGESHLRQDRDSEELMRKAFILEKETANQENERLSDDGHVLYPDEVEDDDGACSSLYLEEDDFSENDDLCQMLPGHTQYSFAGGSKWNHLGKPKMAERPLNEYSSKIGRIEPEVLKRNECYKPTGLFTNPGESPNLNLSDDSCVLNLGTGISFNYEEESNIAKCIQSSTPTDSLFDYYSARKTSSDTETLQGSVADTGKKPISWSQSLQNQELRKHFTQKLELFNMPVLAQDIQHEHNHLEGTEIHSMAGDSGIDSPRTQSLTSNISVSLDEFKRRQNFQKKFEGTKNSQTLTSNSLLQLTPVINV